MTRIGLVLCAGGTVGQAYQAGALAALEHDLGRDPRTADVIVGTSAGSVSGRLLRLGVPASELAAWAAAAPLSVENLPAADLLDGDKPQFPPFTVDHWLRRWRLPSPQLIARVAKRPWAFRPGVAAMTLVPTGRVDMVKLAPGLQDVAADAWPDGLMICAARRKDGARVVFGREGSPTATLPEAVAASCAIPGYFAPIAINGVEYFDGGVHSPSNADILRSLDLDLVIAISPMSAAGGLPRTVDGLYRYAVHRRLERELARLAKRGTTIVRIEPAERSLAAMGVNMMADDRAERVVQAAFVETGGYIAGRPTIKRLAPIDQRFKSHRVGA
jgi:NTE family protein